MGSVPKSKQKQSNIIYFDYAYKMIEGITKFLLQDFGVTRTYNNLTIFTKKANMSEDDKENFEELVNKYHLETEASYPLWIMIHYRDRMLDIMDKLLENITLAYTTFPGSVYEFNVKKQRQSDAISNCYELKHVLQLAINIFPANLKKYVPFVEMIDQEIEYLKFWRKDFTSKNKKQCYINDENAKYKAIDAVNKQRDKADANASHDSTNFFYQIITASTNYNLSHDQLMFNLANTSFYYDSQGRYCSMLYIPAITFYDPKGKVVGDGVTS